jgi:hypothetical protein
MTSSSEVSWHTLQKVYLTCKKTNKSYAMLTPSARRRARLRAGPPA